MTFVRNLLESRFLRTCSSYSLAMGSAVAIKMSLVILMSIIFGFNDSKKFSVYFSFALLADFSSILGTYISLNFLRCKTSSIFAFLLAFIASFLIIYSVWILSLDLYFFGLSMMSISLGLLRRNLMVISNDYLKIEFSNNQNEYGSLLHSMTTAISFFVVFIAGSIINLNSVYAISVLLSLIFFSFIIFFNNQKKYIRDEIIELFEKIEDGRYKPIKFFIFLFIISSSCLLGYFFILLSFKGIEFIENIPLIILICFYIYIIYRARKNKSERNGIFLAISMSLIVILYLGVERQRDMSVALFLQRNISLNIFGFKLSSLQINAFYQLSTIIISFICIRYRVHSKLDHKSTSLISLFLSSIAFFALFLSCIFSNSEGFGNFYLYLIFLFIMSGCNVLIITKFFEICRLMPDSIKHTMSSFMIMNMGVGFYIAKLYSGIIAIDNEIFDRFYSLSVYRSGFLKVFIINFIFTIVLYVLFNFKRQERYIKIKDTGAINNNII